MVKENYIDKSTPNINTGETKNFWEERFGEKGGYEKEPEPRLIAFAEKYKKEIGPKILDIASGIGRHLIYMAEQGYKMTGIELTENGISVAKEKLKEKKLEANLVQGDFKKLPFKDVSFDTAYSTQAINRNDWEGAKKTFSEVSRILKDGGLFFLRVKSNSKSIERPEDVVTVINEPNDYDLPILDKGVTFLKERKNKDGNSSRELIHAYSLEELKKLGEKYHLEIIEEPIDERKEGEKGQWNVVYRKVISE